ncbi:hypothetical protein [Nocardioides humi]|uniref:Htaa protein n=1 Tax=Nocardioides humi TaxID=449461 RepID=A0ABN2BIT5_9ACTN|nr:hypothetical protein [Nocardioides humi]
MNNQLVRRSVAGLTLAALAAVGLAAVPSPARAAVDEAQLGGQYDLYSWNCAGTADGDDLDAVPWSDDNVPVTKSTSASATFTGSEGDVVQATSSTSTSITASPLGSGPATITGSATASASALASGSTTACDVRSQAQSQAMGVFTLTQPMWATLTAAGQGQRQGQAQGASFVGVGNIDGFGSSWEGYFGLGGDGLVVSAGNRGSAVSSTLLPAGTYGVAFASIAYAVASDEGDGSASYTGTFTVDLKPVGSASAATGKGASLVRFGERDCASGDVSVVLGKKTVRKAKRVAFKVDGAKAAVLKGKKLEGRKPKARTVTLPTTATGVTKVKVKIVLANGRRMQATRSYLPCR